jgi:hypothetical protein
VHDKEASREGVVNEHIEETRIDAREEVGPDRQRTNEGRLRQRASVADLLIPPPRGLLLERCWMEVDQRRGAALGWRWTSSKWRRGSGDGGGASGG